MDVSQYLEIFLDETNEHLQNLNTQILELEADPENMDNINEILAVEGVDAFYGFVSGILASDYDCTDLFVDATLKITGRDYAKVGELFEKLAKISGDTVITCTISADNSELPESMKKFIV